MKLKIILFLLTILLFSSCSEDRQGYSYDENNCVEYKNVCTYTPSCHGRFGCEVNVIDCYDIRAEYIDKRCIDWEIKTEKDE